VSQYNAPVRRSGGSLDVYAGLLGAALLVLAAGVFLMATRNLEHSATGGGQGGVIKLIQPGR
jgi:hypothetical protein